MQPFIPLLFSLFVSASVALPPTPPIILNVVAAEPGKVVVSAHDGNGTPLTDLTVDQFSVREDDGLDLPVTQLDGFVDPAAAVGLVLVVDVSGSMAGQPLETARDAIERLAQALGPHDRVAVIAFASDAGLAGLFTGESTESYAISKEELATLVENLRAGGNTALYDAVYKGVKVATVLTEARRAVVVLTDGRDERLRGGVGSGSQVANSDSAILEANRYRIPVFTVGIGQRKDEAYLKRLALQTGGAYQDAAEIPDLEQSFVDILNRMKMRFRVNYDSQLGVDDAPHRVRVALRVGEDVAIAEAQVAAKGTIVDLPPVSKAPGWDPLPAVQAEVEAEPAPAQADTDAADAAGAADEATVATAETTIVTPTQPAAAGAVPTDTAAVGGAEPAQNEGEIGSAPAPEAAAPAPETAADASAPGESAGDTAPAAAVANAGQPDVAAAPADSGASQPSSTPSLLLLAAAGFIAMAVIGGGVALLSQRKRV